MFKLILYKIKYKIFSFYIIQNIQKYFINKCLTRFKAKKIKNFIESKNETFIFVYDLRVSSIAYGDFFQNLILLKYISIFKRTKIIFINFARKNFHHHQSINKKEKIKRLLEFTKICNLYLGKKNVKIFNFKKFSKFNKKNLVWEKDKVERSIPIYTYSLNTLHYLYEKKNYYKFIISKKDFKSLKLKKKLPKNFITFAVKYNSNTASRYRDYTIKEIYSCLEYFYQKYRKYKVMIVSDKNTTLILKKILDNKKNKILFSKDFGKDFIDDLKICNHSKLFFSYKPSGSSTLVEYSSIPYRCYHLNKPEFSIFTKNTLPNDLFYKKKIRHPWQTNKQLWLIPIKNDLKNAKIMSKVSNV